MNRVCADVDRVGRRGYGGKGLHSREMLDFVLCMMREAFEALLEN